MSLPVSSGFQKINSWEKAIPFAGRVVAYETDDSYSFGGSKGDGYTVGNTHFGYVDEKTSNWPGMEKGYALTKLLKPNEVTFHLSALVASALSKSSISMRLATKDEINLIRNAISMNEARFEFMSNSKIINDIFDKHISKL